MNNRSRHYCCLVLSLIGVLGLGLRSESAWAIDQEPVVISTLAELEAYAAKSGNAVKMEPGVYQLADLLTDEVIAARLDEARAIAKKRGVNKLDTYMFRFGGSNNTFDLTGVTIEVDTKFLSVFKGCYIREFLIDGNRVTIEGLTIRDIGNGPTARGGNSMSVHGNDVTLKDVVLHVSGSYPYGYGDLLGKGKRSVVKHRKHSGLLVCGVNTKLIGCKVFMRAFGHAFFVQGGVNVHFENCYAEGEVRATNDMLAETSGPAFENGFRTVYAPNTIQPNYMKSLNECGFRTYGKGGPTQRETGKVTLINCVAKNVRVGFALALPKGDRVTLKDCEAIECERGYYLSRAIAENCRGDAKYGPLLYLVGDRANRSKVELTLTPATSNITVNALATISGEGHEITLNAESAPDKLVPILIGYNPPPGGENSAPINENSAKNIQLTNRTGMPIEFGKNAVNSKVLSNGPVTRDDGKGNEVRELSAD